jgi:hypothetical protein
MVLICRLFKEKGAGFIFRRTKIAENRPTGIIPAKAAFNSIGIESVTSS